MINRNDWDSLQLPWLYLSPVDFCFTDDTSAHGCVRSCGRCMGRAGRACSPSQHQTQPWVITSRQGALAWRRLREGWGKTKTESKQTRGDECATERNAPAVIALWRMTKMTKGERKTEKCCILMDAPTYKFAPFNCQAEGSQSLSFGPAWEKRRCTKKSWCNFIVHLLSDNSFVWTKLQKELFFWTKMSILEHFWAATLQELQEKQKFGSFAQ